jgi:hypothetical protein
MSRCLMFCTGDDALKAGSKCSFPRTSNGTRWCSIGDVDNVVEGHDKRCFCEMTQVITSQRRRL